MNDEEIDQARLAQEIEKLTCKDRLTWQRADKCGFLERYKCIIGNLLIVFKECRSVLVISTLSDEKLILCIKKRPNLSVCIRDQMRRQRTIGLAQNASQVLSVLSGIFDNK